MGKGLRAGLVVALAAATLAVGPVVGDAAWAKKAKIKCKVNGEGFKTNVKAGGAGGVYTPETQMLILGGARAKIHGRNPATVEADIRVIEFGVVSVPDLSTAQLPLSLPVDETLFSIHRTQGVNDIETTAWIGEGVTMTITAFDGSRIKGTAEGTIPPQVGTDTPAVLEDCKFTLGLDGLPTP